VKRFRIKVDHMGRGTVTDLNTGEKLEGVTGVSVIVKAGEPTRVDLSFVTSEVDITAADAREDRDGLSG